jgi:hypothetical protein
MNNKLKLALTGAVLAHALVQPNQARAGEGEPCDGTSYAPVSYGSCTNSCNTGVYTASTVYYCFEYQDYSTTTYCGCYQTTGHS